MNEAQRSAISRAIGRLTRMSSQKQFVLVLMVSSVTALIWASVAEVDVIVRAEGQIIPAGKSQIVQHLEGGIVEKILVEEGEMVTAAQPLMVLSDVQTRASLSQEKSKLDALRGREARLISEVQGDAEVTFPEALNDQDVIRVERAAWDARRRQLAEEVQVLKAQSQQKVNELTEIKARQKNLLDELVLVQKKHHVLEDLRKNNAASEMEVLDSQMRIQQLKTEISEASNTLPRLQAAQAEAEARVKEAVARFRAEASAALTQVREELETLRHGLDSSVDRQERNIVRSPVAGLVNKLNVTTVGAVVRPSEILLEITPSDQRIVIEARANPNDRAHLRRGLSARVRVGAYDYATYGTFEGRVTEVSADTLKDERENRYYRVNIEVDLTDLAARDNPPGVLMPGMGASADIAVGKRTILSYLLSPMLRFRDGAFRAS